MNPGLVPVLAVGSLLAAGALIHRERMGWTYWVFRHRVSADTKLEY